MNNMRKVLCFLMALMLAAFALPGNAASTVKNFSYTVAGGPVPTSLDLTVSVLNANPLDGNSNYNSFKLTAPSQLLITGAELPVCAGVQTTGPGTFFLPAPNANGVSVIGVQGLPPVRPQTGCTMTVHVKLNPSYVATCGTTDSSPWAATVYTGANLAGQTYNNVSTPQNPTTGLVKNCNLSFTSPPNNAFQGAVITNTSFNQPPGAPVQTQLLINGSPASGVTVNLSLASCSWTGSTGTLAGGTATTDSNGLATFGASVNQPAQNCTLSATASGASAGPTAAFGIAAFVPQAQVACGAQIPTQYTFPPANPNLTPNDPGYVLVTRGQWNAKGETCALVPFQFSNKVLVDDTLIQKWDTSSQPSAAFLYQVNSKVKTGIPVFTPPKVAWEFDSSGTPVNVLDALKCLTSDFPKPYGRLNSQLAAGVTTYTLDRSDPQPVNGWKTLPALGVTFPLYLDGERINAQVQSGLTLTLVRGQAGTTATSAGVTHNPRGGNTPNDATDDNYFLSTPLPIDTRVASPYNGKAVHMCWTVYGLQAYDAGTGVDSYFQITDLFDFGDGFGAWE